MRSSEDGNNRCSFLKFAIGDGALGFWGALNEVFPSVLHQRCWFHKMGNILNLLPKSMQPKAKAALQ